MRIAVLALQGAFLEHEQMLHQLGVETFEVRQFADWPLPPLSPAGSPPRAGGQIDGLVIPGGESTTQMKLLRELGLEQPVKAAISGGLPVFGTCAGLILLSQSHLGTMQIEARRNAYGRQLGSFYTEQDIAEIGPRIPMTFIRAPYISKVYGEARALVEVDGHIVAARQGRQLVTAFHPELNSDTRVHDYFLRTISA